MESGAALKGPRGLRRALSCARSFPAEKRVTAVVYTDRKQGLGLRFGDRRLPMFEPDGGRCLCKS